MLKKLTVILALLISLLNPVNANAADDYLLSVDMNEATSWDSSKLLPLNAQLKKVRFQIPRENPDKLIAQIILKNPLAPKQAFPDSKWILGLWLFAPNIRCFDTKTCDYILQIQPSYGNMAFIYTYKNQFDANAGVLSDCKAPWYFKKDTDGSPIVAIELSISCLNISSTFVSYAFSSYDIGITPRQWQYTDPNYVENPYLQLAEKSYLANGGKGGLGTVVGSPDFENFKASVLDAREVFDSMMDRYQTLAIESQKKLDKKIEWKKFLKLEDDLVEIEDSLETFLFSSNADKLKAAVALQNLIKLKTMALQLQLTSFPQYQCYNQVKGLTKALSSAKSCPKGYKKVKT